MMVFSKIFSKKFLKNNIKLNLIHLKSGMNIDLLMIWLLIWLNQMEVLSGRVKIMMEMFKVIFLLKVKFNYLIKILQK